MINTFIAYDDNDFELSDYFIGSHTDITSAFSVNSLITNFSISGLECTEENITNTLSSLNGGKFIFIALSHGNDEQLVSHEAYVSQKNTAIFINSLFYTSACSTGAILGKKLINAGCLTYVGYYDTVNVIEGYYDVFFACENFGIKTFLSNDETIVESFNKMIEYYNNEIDRLTVGTIDDLLAATTLIGNRDSLILLGNETLTRKDLH